MCDFKKRCALAFLALLLVLPVPALALDAASAQADCKSIAQASHDAQMRYLSIYKPRVDPMTTFTLSTDVCLAFITNFDVGFSITIPSLGDLDAFLRRMATAILTRVCQMATQAFNNAVNDAINAINEKVAPLNSIPGVNVGVGGTSGGTGGVNVGGSVTNDGGALVNGAANNVGNQVVNTLK